jgi:hypothetical protein
MGAVLFETATGDPAFDARRGELDDVSDTRTGVRDGPDEGSDEPHTSDYGPTGERLDEGDWRRSRGGGRAASAAARRRRRPDPRPSPVPAAAPTGSPCQRSSNTGPARSRARARRGAVMGGHVPGACSSLAA